MTRDPQIAESAIRPRLRTGRSGIRLLIASEHPIVRSALASMLKGIQGFEVVAESDLSGSTTKAQDSSANVVLLELTEIGMTGLRTVAALVHADPGAALVILTSNENPSYVRSMLATGVKAYVLRSASNSQLFEAIRCAHRGKRYLDPRLSDSITYLLLGRNGGAVRKPHTKRLSAREAQVLREIAQGHTTRTIAQKLGVGERTIQTYRERIYEKLGLRSRADLVHYAIAHGMLNLTETNP
jgi:two-component system response regulator NreC